MATDQAGTGAGEPGALSPLSAADHLEQGLAEYLATSFALTDPAAGRALADFLQAPDTGMFYGPYLRTRLPYRQTDTDERLLEWLPEKFDFKPYAHQAAAFQRLRSRDADGPRRPMPTMVVTGTGSGKTEAFLYPVLDHAVRARRRGETGIKALLLYPMNALANDQANRLRLLLADEPGLAGVRVGVYTGESTDGDARGAGSAAGGSPAGTAENGRAAGIGADAFTYDRAEMRRNPPDILLTNYKMLDQLLLRPEDRALWEKSAKSLTYLVLDEFHTYDGAQGTDVALLLRRLGLKLKSLQPEGFLDAEAAVRPLGTVTPVATSATLGNDADPTAMLRFARTIFGEEFTDAAVITDSAMDVHQWAADVTARYGSAELPEPLTPREAVAAVTAEVVARTGPEQADADQARSQGAPRTQPQDFVTAVRHAVVDNLLGGTTDLDDILSRYAHSGWITGLLEAAATARPLSGGSDSLTAALVPAAARRHFTAGEPELFTACLVAFIADTRARLTARASWDGKRVPGVEVHLWAREVSRIDRATGAVAGGRIFRWADNGPATDATFEPDTWWLPACYCRHCGRSGWMVAQEPNGEAVELDGPRIRATSVRAPELQRPVFDAAREVAEIAESTAEGGTPALGRILRWLDLEQAAFTATPPDDESRDSGRVIAVRTYDATMKPDDLERAARDEVCPACGERDAIRYIGSSVSTLLSVALSNLFGLGELDEAEKKTLVFTDSVQDAAHRAGFVQARSRTFELRAMMNAAVAGDGGDGPVNLTELTERLMDRAGEDDRRRFELLPRQVARLDAFRAFWQPGAGKAARRNAEKRARDRVAFDVDLEFGQRADLPRSLVSTGTLTCQVDAADADLESAAADALVGIQGDLFDRDGLAWARGVVELIRTRGGIFHPWLKGYLKSDLNPWRLNRRQARVQGVPAFPRGGTPEFPRLGRRLTDATTRGFTPADAPTGRLARWTSATLGLPAQDAAAAVAALLDALSRRGVLAEPGGGERTETGGRVFGIEPEQVLVAGEAHPEALRCSHCAAVFAFGPDARRALSGARCLTPACPGTLSPHELADNYYRGLYRAPRPRGIIAREHTGLLETAERREIEQAFRAGVSDGQATRPDAPNVLVATPTLEMGIDIGDLSTVMLASMPPTVASYVQRVGRAGRLTGNSLVFATVRGRGASLPKLLDPLSVIAGAVRPPAAFLRATEILRRQFTAFLLDTTATELLEGVRTARAAIRGEAGRPGVIDTLLERVRGGVENELAAFTDALAGEITAEDAAALSAWAKSEDTGGMAATLTAARARWEDRYHGDLKRLDHLEKRVAELERIADSKLADEVTAEELTTARRTARQTRRGLNTMRDKWWIEALEYEGLLPNFTLLDDVVEVTVGVNVLEIQEDGRQEYRLEENRYTRGLASALQELAPGATFYARGIAATIDTVAVGAQGPDIQYWRVCPQCSHIEVETPGEAAEALAGPCPRCGAHGFADIAQRLPVVPMTGVSAEVEQTRAAIGADRDDRYRKFFPVAMAFDVPAEPGGAAPAGSGWYTGVGFGVRDLPRVELRWLNLGSERGEELVLSGRKFTAGLFTVCSRCGHVPAPAHQPPRYGHQPWCPHRDAGTVAAGRTEQLTLEAGGEKPGEAEDEQARFALGRTLATQGLLVHVPRLVSVSDDFAVPSLTAALKLGLRECLGGDPDHLGVSTVRVNEDVAGDETEGTVHGVAECLLLFDQVPGGTGYLTQFAVPEAMRRLLMTAYLRVRDCECGKDERLSCPECLLPYTGANQEQVSRASAEQTLYRLLIDDLHPEDGAEIAELSDAAPATPADAVIVAPPDLRAPEPDAPGRGAAAGTDAASASGATHPNASGGPEHVGNWEISAEAPAGDPGSALELRFRELLREHLLARSFDVESRSRAGRTEMLIKAPGSKASWRMEAEVDLGTTRADFLFTHDDARVRNVAVYLDGATFHYGQGAAKIAEDIAKRAGLHSRGYLPWTLTWADLERFAAQAGADTAWYTDAPALEPVQRAANSQQVDMLAHDPLRQLVDYLVTPDEKVWAALSEQAAFNLATAARATGRAQPVDARLLREGLHTEKAIAGNIGQAVDFIWAPGEAVQLVLGGTAPTRPEWNLFLNLANLAWARPAGAAVACQSNLELIREIAFAVAAPTRRTGPTESAPQAPGPAEDAAGGAHAARRAGDSGSGAAAGGGPGAAASGAGATGAANGGTAGAAGDSPAPGWQRAIAEFDPREESEVIEALSALAAEGVAAPQGEVGAQIGDLVAEVSWPGDRVALVWQDEPGAAAPEGWEIFTLADVSAGNIPKQLPRAAAGGK